MKNTALKYGLLGALVVIAYFFGLYYLNKELFLRPALQWGSLVIYLAFMIQAAREETAGLGANRDFRERVRTPFIVFLLINLGYWLFYYSLHLADVELIQMETAKQIQHLQGQLSAGTGDPQQANKIREQIQYLQTAPPVQTLGPVLLQMCLGAVGGFGLAAGVVSVLRKGN